MVYYSLGELCCFFGDNSTVLTCSGSGTSSSYCALQGKSYQLALVNNNNTNATISGQITLTER